MYLDKSIFYVKIQILQQSLLGTNPFNFSPNSQKLVLKDKTWLRREYIKIALLTIYCAVLWLQFILDKTASTAETMEYLLCANGVAVFWLTKVVVYQKRKSIVELFNLFIQFEQRYLQGKFFVIYFLNLKASLTS